MSWSISPITTGAGSTSTKLRVTVSLASCTRQRRVSPAGIQTTAATEQEPRMPGLWWGAYHFGTGGDGIKQAQNFLDTVGDPSDTLLVLDFESNRTGPSMDLIEARAFVSHIAAATGQIGLYSGHGMEPLLGSESDPILAQCWFWLAQYGPTPVVPRNWETWTLWQYTDGAFGSEPHTVAGLDGARLVQD